MAVKTVMNAKQKALLDRIKRLEDEISKGQEYLKTGAHGEWHGFRALFAAKARDGKPLPPHPDWVRNVFLPRREMALRQAEKILEKLCAELAAWRKAHHKNLSD
jgi:hypothetical protein